MSDVNVQKLAGLGKAERAALIRRSEADLSFFLAKVQPIIEAVKTEGDAALVRFGQQFDGAEGLTAATLQVSEAEFDAAFDLVDDLFTSDEEREAAKLKLIKAEQAGQLDTLKASLSAILAEANSKDPWTSRARPTFLYLMYLVILLCVFGGVLSVWWPSQVLIAADGMKALLNAIPESLYALFGMGYLGYTGARTFDKWKSK